MKKYVYNILINQEINDLITLKLFLLKEFENNLNNIEENVKNILFIHIKESTPPKTLYNNKIKTFYTYNNISFKLKINYDKYLDKFMLSFSYNKSSLVIEVFNINKVFNIKFSVNNVNEFLFFNDSSISWIEKLYNLNENNIFYDLNNVYNDLNNKSLNEIFYDLNNVYHEFNNKTLDDIYKSYLTTNIVDYESLDFIFLETEKTYPFFIYFLENIEKLKVNFL